MADYTDVSLPPFDAPRVFRMPDGRTMRISVEIANDQAPITGNSPIPVPRVEFATTPVPQPVVPQPVREIAPVPVPTTPVISPVIPAFDPNVFDHPVIGSRFTAFTLLYGDYFEMHHQCLSSFLATAPADRVELRVGSNQLGQRSREYVDELVRSGAVAVHYANEQNRRKYPVMREMFRDPLRPIGTNYILWFDDDTVFDIEPRWLAKLSQSIVQSHGKGFRMFGPLRYWTLKPGQDQWIRQAGWYRGRAFCDKAGNETPNGNNIFFPVGAFFAMATHLIREQDIPDARLSHQGDTMVGAQVTQAGWRVKDFSQQKQFVRWSAYTRRGASELPVGATG